MPKTRSRQSLSGSHDDELNNSVTLSRDNFTALLSTIQKSNAEICERMLERLSTFTSPLTAQSPAPASSAAEKTGNFSRCTSRFSGAAKENVEAFIDAIEAFKECTNICDDVAIRGMSMLLTSDAATWWQSIRAEVTSWEDAIQYLRDAYGDRRPEYKIYRELFRDEQGENERTDIFVAKSRALLTRLPAHDLSTKVQLDMIYGLLHRKIRKRLRREEVSNFSELLSKSRNIEDSLNESTKRQSQNTASIASRTISSATETPTQPAMNNARTSNSAVSVRPAHGPAITPRGSGGAGAPPSAARPQVSRAHVPNETRAQLASHAYHTSEATARDEHAPASKRERPFCVYCKKYGHHRDQCRKLMDKGESAVDSNYPVSCYKCGSKNVTRETCKKCNNEPSFCSVDTPISRPKYTQMSKNRDNITCSGYNHAQCLNKNCCEDLNYSNTISTATSMFKNVDANICYAVQENNNRSRDSSSMSAYSQAKMSYNNTSNSVHSHLSHDLSNNHVTRCAVDNNNDRFCNFSVYNCFSFDDAPNVKERKCDFCNFSENNIFCYDDARIAKGRKYHSCNIVENRCFSNDDVPNVKGRNNQIIDKVCSATCVENARAGKSSDGIVLRPIFDIKILGASGTALIDTGAKHCIAGHTLHTLLCRKGHPLEPARRRIKLADGCTRDVDVLMTTLDVHLEEKVIRTPFLILPEARNNETLLGMDFLFAAEVVMDFSRECWYFSNNRRVQYTMRFEPSFTPELSCSSADVLRDDEGTLLKPPDRNLLAQTLVDNTDIFQLGGEPTPFAEHRIDTGEHPPIYVPPYRLTPAKKELMRQEIEKMLKDNMIEECESAWCSPALLVPKANGSTRFCVDYRRINAVTKTDHYPMPLIDELLQSTKRDGYMSTLDLRSCINSLAAVPERVELQQEQSKKVADRSRRPSPMYEVGDKVLLQSHVLSQGSKGLTAKFVPKRDGSYVITKKVSPTTYVISPIGNPEESLGKYHAQDLTPFVDSGTGNKLPPNPVIPKRRRGRPKHKGNEPVQERGRSPRLEGEYVANNCSPRTSRRRRRVCLPSRFNDYALEA